MAKRLKRTPWFPAEVKPVLPGLYESKGGVLLWLWSGKEWRSPGDSRTCFCQERTWRGLAEDPNRAPTRGAVVLISKTGSAGDTGEQVDGGAT